MIEKFSINQPEDQPDNLVDNQWDESSQPTNEQQPDDEVLPLFSEAYSGYKISSAPFDKKEDAYEEIRQYWQGADVTTYSHNGKWYIVSK